MIHSTKTLLELLGERVYIFINVYVYSTFINMCIFSRDFGRLVEAVRNVGERSNIIICSYPDQAIAAAGDAFPTRQKRAEDTYRSGSLAHTDLYMHRKRHQMCERENERSRERIWLTTL